MKDLQTLFKHLDLGEVIECKPVTGGLLHKMYKVDTKDASYAVKVLNPEIMSRPNVKSHLLESEKFAKEARQVCNSIHGLEINGQLLHHISSDYIVYPWFEGESVFEFTNDRAYKMGRVLASIHTVRPAIVKSDEHHINDWTLFKDHKYYQLIESDLHDLDELERRAYNAKALITDQVFSHRDLDPKNVMWLNEEPYPIDWEAAGYVGPMMELIELAYYWSKDKATFLSVLEGYKSVRKINSLSPLVDTLYCNLLNWLFYSMKLATEKVEGNQAQGIKETKSTLEAIKGLSDKILDYKEWLNED